VGYLNLQVRSQAAARRQLRVRLFPDDSPNPVLLGARPLRAARGVSVRLVEPPRKALRISPQELIRVSVKFSLDVEAPPSRMASQLAIDVKPQARPGQTSGAVATGPVAPLLLRLKGVTDVPRGVSFAPDSVALSVTTHRAWLGDSGTTADVRLRGEGATAFVSAMRGRGLSTVIRSDSDASMVVLLTNLRTVDGEARATIEVKDIEAEGKYEGNIALAPGATHSPKLNVTVEANDWFVWAVLTLLAGAVSGLVFTRLLQRRWRRGRVEGALTAALQKYEIDGTRYSKAPKWKALERDLGDPPWYGPRLKCEEFPTSLGVGTLVCRIRNARADDDLGDDEAEAKSYVDRIRFWCWLAPELANLAKALDEQSGQRNVGSFTETLTYQDAEALLVEAEQERKTLDRAKKFAARVGEQVEVLRKARELWDLQRELEGDASVLTAQQRDQLTQNDLKELERDDPKNKPTVTEMRELRRRLDRALRTVGGLEPRGGLKQAVDNVAESGLGSATASAGQRSGQLLVDLVAGLSNRRTWSPLKVLGRITRPEVLSTLAAVVVAGIAYMLPVYDATWGSREDYLTAFTVGFLGKFGFDWGAQLIFRSERLGKTGGAAKTSDDTQPPAGKPEPQADEANPAS
jgi:hypothetical protein